MTKASSRKIKSSVSVKVSRPQTNFDHVSIIRNVSVHRNANGQLGSTTSYATSLSGNQRATLDIPETQQHEITDPPIIAPILFDPLEDVGMEDEEQLDSLDTINAPKVTKHHAMEEWLPFRQAYLDEILRHDGREGCKTSLCESCGCAGDYMCRDCAYHHHYCQGCMVERHSDQPLQRILHWTSTFYNDCTLKQLGLIIQLGHNGLPCPIPGPVQQDFVIINVSGLHLVDIMYCGCYHSAGGSRNHIQLLHFRWFPSTITRPRSAFTFDVLDTFHLLTLQGKVSAYDYYLSLAHKTDNTGLLNIKYQYLQFLTVIRQWQHLKALKRAGQGHDHSGIVATTAGQCAVECPACPHPGRNLPENWMDAPDTTKWLYTQNLTMDADFRLKNKDRGIKNDPPLGDGWGHWVPDGPYQDYIKEYGYQDEPNLCDSNLHAVDHANTRFSKGYTATGVGGVLCARHGLVRKNGMGNLQKGERYTNMDFIVFFTLIGTILQLLVFSYDIACQWHRNLVKRLPQLPAIMQISREQFNLARFVVPKFHISVHGLLCQTRFSLNFLPFMARINGEEPERWWAHINPVSMSTKEMGPGARLDTIDDHAAAWNWRKITGFGNSLRTQLARAIVMAKSQRERHDELTSTFPFEVVQKWEKMVEDWNADPQAPNPYVEPLISTSMATVRLELAQEEAASAQQGEVSPNEMSPFTFVQVGLDLEDQQRTLAQQAKGKKTVREEADLVEKRNVLHRRIKLWFEVRNSYIPALSEHAREDHASDTASVAHTPRPELTLLNLPSALPVGLRSSCLYGLPDIERRLRLAQADDALSDLRRHLRITMGLRHYKTTQVGPNHYHAARAALLALDPNGDWVGRLRELKDGDIKGPGKDDDEAEGTRELSWIWWVERRSGIIGIALQDELGPMSDDDISDCLRCEWAKSKARASRWAEEVQLLVEEMRRVIAFLDWKAQWWSQLSTAQPELQRDIADGVSAYAAKQAYISHSLAKSFAGKWFMLLTTNSLLVEWPVSYIPTTNVAPTTQDVDSETD